MALSALGLGDTVVFGDRLDSLIVELFSNHSDPVTPTCLQQRGRAEIKAAGAGNDWDTGDTRQSRGTATAQPHPDEPQLQGDAPGLWHLCASSTSAIHPGSSGAAHRTASEAS